METKKGFLLKLEPNQDRNICHEERFQRAKGIAHSLTILGKRNMGLEGKMQASEPL